MTEEPNEYLVECPRCNSKTLAESITQTIPKFATDPWIDHWYTIVQCRICYQFMLVEQPRDVSEGTRKVPKILWPQYDQELSDKIPEVLRREVSEARVCFTGGAHTAAVVMVRRTLEGICADHGMKSYPLFKSIEQMKDSGLIDGRLLEWAQALRTLGNEGAHFTGNRVNRQDAEDSLAFAAAILNYMYVFNEQFAEFNKRRQSLKAVKISTKAKGGHDNNSSDEAEQT